MFSHLSVNLLCYILCSFVFCLTTFLAIFCYRRNGLGNPFFSLKNFFSGVGRIEIGCSSAGKWGCMGLSAPELLVDRDAFCAVGHRSAVWLCRMCTVETPVLSHTTRSLSTPRRQTLLYLFHRMLLSSFTC